MPTPNITRVPPTSPAARAASDYYGYIEIGVIHAQTLLRLAREQLSEILQGDENRLVLAERADLILEAAQGKLAPLQADIEALYAIAKTSRAKEV